MISQKGNVGGGGFFGKVKDAHQNLPVGEIECPIRGAVTMGRNDARTLQSNARVAGLQTGPCPLAKQKSPIFGGDGFRVGHAKTRARGAGGADTDAAESVDISRKQPLLILEDCFAVKYRKAAQIARSLNDAHA